MSTWQGIQNPRKPSICSLVNTHIRANIMQQVHYVYSSSNIQFMERNLGTYQPPKPSQ